MMSEQEIESPVVEQAPEAPTSAPEADDETSPGADAAETVTATDGEPGRSPEPSPGAATEPGSDGAAESATTEPDATESEATEPSAEGGAGASADSESAAAGAKRERRGRPRLKLEELEVGTEFHGKVVGLAKFGAFVDIGAVTDGLVHLTEFPGKRLRKPEDAIALGDEVDVWLKAVDLEGNRLTLSMRKKPVRPIAELGQGDVLTGTVTSATDYGLFVDIGSETEGLVHISEISSGYVQKPADIAKAGDAVEVRVKEIDLGRERISLSMVGLANDIGLTAQAEEAATDVEAEPDDPGQPEERRPTVVELALRRALGELEDAEETAEETEVAEATGAKGSQESLGEIYERMLAEYRASKSEG